MNQGFTCIVIDDEEYAIGMLSESINSLYDNIRIIGSYTSWKDGLKALRETKTDILFLDISLGGKTGMDVLKLLPELGSEIIFITAYLEYALEAFKFSATGYVVKPVNEEDLVLAINKAIERIKNKRSSAITHKQEQAVVSKIGIPSNNGVDYINVNDILFFEASSGYTKVEMTGRHILSSFRLGKYKEILEGQPFYQVHRSYIVNLNHIKRYNSSGDIVMVNDKEIPVSKNQREEFLHLFNIVSKGGDE